jgi:hypothetical protein
MNIYEEALNFFGSGKQDKLDKQIASEANWKAKIILGALEASPEDPAFSTVGQILKPLEPQYAHPRLSAKEDDYGRRAQWWLNAWRKEGWPAVHPKEAIRHEAEKERLVATEREIRR